MVYIGADHRGYQLKEKLKKFLEELGHDCKDLGAFEYNKDDDYPDFSKKVAESVVLRQAQDQNDRGILICGSGIGIAIAANKIKGIRAGTAISPEQVRDSVNDENLNVLAISADYTGEKEAQEIVEAFLDTEFSGEERHIRRINEIKDIENGN
ncbi:MAG TPA: RpiB/LacA/LacB family sugar-phosphate isomerase [Candidatus Paceibacterota bacterium]